MNGSRNISLPGVFAGTNPSPAVLPNGSMVVGVHDDVGFVVFMAPTWRGPYTRVPGHLFTFEFNEKRAELAEMKTRLSLSCRLLNSQQPLLGS